MLTRDFDNLPALMKSKAVRLYYEMLSEKRASLVLKRLFDVMFSFLLIVLLAPVMIITALLIKLDSKGPVFYRQIRVTKNLKEFKIIKFRTMKDNTGDKDLFVTLDDDIRVTKAGGILRKYRLDELPQLFNILVGEMSFVGTRPEVPKYVAEYKDEMMATLLLPGGLTSTASILYRNEAVLLKSEISAEQTYINEIMPKKMIHNLEYLRDYSFWGDITILFKTLFSAA